MNMQQTKIQRLQMLLKAAKIFAQFILGKRQYWSQYGQNTASKKQWSSHISTYIVKLIQSFKDINLEDLPTVEQFIQKIKKQIESTAYEWRHFGQGGTGEAFADWLSIFQKMIDQLIVKIRQVLNEEATKQSKRILLRKGELEDKIRRRKEKSRSRSRSAQRPKRQMIIINEDSQQDRRKKREQQMFIESQRNWLKQRLQRKKQECNKLSQELSDEKIKSQKRNQEGLRLAQELEYEKIRIKSLQTYVDELKKQIVIKDTQIQRLKRSNGQRYFF